MEEKQQTNLDALEIDRPDEWLEEASAEVDKFLELKGDIFQQLSIKYMLATNPEALAIIMTHPQLLSDGVVHLNKFLYHIGYLKGLADREDKYARDVQLRKLVDEG